MYGTQTYTKEVVNIWQFENDVNMYGTQTVMLRVNDAAQFENDDNCSNKFSYCI